MTEQNPLWRIGVFHGPNLQALGTRQPEVYGTTTLADIERALHALAVQLGAEVRSVQTNHEGVMLDAIDEARRDGVHGIIVNPGAWTHYNYAIRDALAMLEVPIIEVHLSNVYQRESFRHTSVTAPVVWGVIAGLGPMGYAWALHALVARLEASDRSMMIPQRSLRRDDEEVTHE